VILIAGPSSSGKTTFSNVYPSNYLPGFSPFPLEMDNYFVDREATPRDANGNYNFESLGALDTHLLSDHLKRLIRGETVRLPRYDFRDGKRKEGEEVRLRPDQMIILEGIHGLNPELLPEIEAEKHTGYMYPA